MLQTFAMTGEASARKTNRLRGRVKCGVCSQKLLFVLPRATYTCKRCKKTLPRRFASPRSS